MKEERHSPNPKGKAGKPITLAPMSFDDAARKMLATAPPKPASKTVKSRKQPAKP